MNKTKKYNYFRKNIDNEYSKDKTRKIQSGGGPPPRPPPPPPPPPPRRPPPLPPRPTPNVAKAPMPTADSVSKLLDKNPNVKVPAQLPENKKKFWPFTRKKPVEGEKRSFFSRFTRKNPVEGQPKPQPPKDKKPWWKLGRNNQPAASPATTAAPAVVSPTAAAAQPAVVSPTTAAAAQQEPAVVSPAAAAAQPSSPTAATPAAVAAQPAAGDGSPVAPAAPAAASHTTESGAASPHAAASGAASPHAAASGAASPHAAASGAASHTTESGAASPHAAASGAQHGGPNDQPNPQPGSKIRDPNLVTAELQKTVFNRRKETNIPLSPDGITVLKDAENKLLNLFPGSPEDTKKFMAAQIEIYMQNVLPNVMESVKSLVEDLIAQNKDLQMRMDKIKSDIEKLDAMIAGETDQRKLQILQQQKENLNIDYEDYVNARQDNIDKMWSQLSKPGAFVDIKFNPDSYFMNPYSQQPKPSKSSGAPNQSSPGQGQGQPPPPPGQIPPGAAAAAAEHQNDQKGQPGQKKGSEGQNGPKGQKGPKGPKGAGAGSKPKVSKPPTPSLPSLPTQFAQAAGGNITRKNRQYIHEIKDNRTHIFNKEMEIINSIRNFKHGHNHGHGPNEHGKNKPENIQKKFIKVIKRS